MGHIYPSALSAWWTQRADPCPKAGKGPMPKGDYYYGLPLAAAISKFADHHFEPKNRHISEDEYRLLLRAVNALEADRELRDAVVTVHDA